MSPTYSVGTYLLYHNVHSLLIITRPITLPVNFWTTSVIILNRMTDLLALKMSKALNRTNTPRFKCHSWPFYEGQNAVRWPSWRSCGANNVIILSVCTCGLETNGYDSGIEERNGVCFHSTLNNPLMCVQPMREERKNDVRDYLPSLSTGINPVQITAVFVIINTWLILACAKTAPLWQQNPFCGRSALR